MKLYTSQTSPLRIAEISIPNINGKIGLTLCPGKKGPSAQRHTWARDLEADLSAIVAWRAKSIVSLLESNEFEMLGVNGLGLAIKQRGIDWYHVEIMDGQRPDGRFLNRWPALSATLASQLRCDERVLIHCRGGLGRTGTVAAILLVDLNVDVNSAIAMVRAARPGAIETLDQEAFVGEYAGVAATTSLAGR